MVLYLSSLYVPFFHLPHILIIYGLGYFLILFKFVFILFKTFGFSLIVSSLDNIHYDEKKKMWKQNITAISRTITIHLSIPPSNLYYLYIHLNFSIFNNPLSECIRSLFHFKHVSYDTRYVSLRCFV